MFLWLNFTREERHAMRKKIPMTQEIFDSILKKREEIGEEAEELAMQLMFKYPEFLEVTARQICEEVGIDFDAEPTELPEFDVKLDFDDLMKRIEEAEKQGKKRKKEKQYVL